MTKVCIAGSRDWAHKQLVRDYIKELEADDVVVTGAGGAVDLEAEVTAGHVGLDRVIFPANWKKWGRAAGPMRNRKMAEYADRLVVFWDGGSASTKNCIDEFKHLGKRVWWIGHDGKGLAL